MRPSSWRARTAHTHVGLTRAARVDKKKSPPPFPWRCGFFSPLPAHAPWPGRRSACWPLSRARARGTAREDRAKPSARTLARPGDAAHGAAWPCWAVANCWLSLHAEIAARTRVFRTLLADAPNAAQGAHPRRATRSTRDAHAARRRAPRASRQPTSRRRATSPPRPNFCALMTIHQYRKPPRAYRAPPPHPACIPDAARPCLMNERTR